MDYRTVVRSMIDELAGTPGGVSVASVLGRRQVGRVADMHENRTAGDSVERALEDEIEDRDRDPWGWMGDLKWIGKQVTRVTNDAGDNLEAVTPDEGTIRCDMGLYAEGFDDRSFKKSLEKALKRIDDFLEFSEDERDELKNEIPKSFSTDGPESRDGVDPQDHFNIIVYPNGKAKVLSIEPGDDEWSCEILIGLGVEVEAYDEP